MTSVTRSRQQVLSMVRAVGVVPVIRAGSAEVALRVVEALARAGLPIAEITFTVPNAVAAIEAASREFGDAVLVAAGTVLDRDSAQRAIDAGAGMLVTPCLNDDVLALTRLQNVPMVPGALTPTEIMAAVSAGAEMVKVFPAGSVGGASYLRALRGPFPDLALIPTGGVTLENVGDFMRAGAAAVGVGGELVTRDLLERADYKGIGVLAARYVRAVVESRQPRG